MLTLAQTQALNELAQYIYDFLPATPHPYANQDISFKGIALSLNLGKYWTGGSKLPAITQMLTSILEYESNKFCQFILETVRRGITYRQGKNNPITRKQIETLNEIIARVGFKIPELYDSKFLNSLPHHSVTNAKEKSGEFSLEVAQALQSKLIEISKLPAQERGFKFEVFLQDLFTACNMAPRSSFRNIGEQIDGSMVLDNNIYLIEAKWQNAPIGQAGLIEK